MSHVQQLQQVVDTKVKLKAQWRGSNIKLTYSIARLECGEMVKNKYVSLGDLALVHLIFTLDARNMCRLQPMISFKKHENAKNSIVGIKVSCEKFVKQDVCANEWINYIHLGPAIDTNKNITNCKFKVIHQFFLDIEVNITVSDITPKPLPFLKKLCDDSTFTDFTLKARDGTVDVHKAVLGMHSDVFVAMLNGEWKETAEGIISLNGVTRQTLQDLKNYMYLSTLPEDQLRIQQLLLLAACYMVDNLKTTCIKKLVTLVTPETFDVLVEFACQGNVPDLMKAMFTETPDNIVHGILEKKKINKISTDNLKLWKNTT